MPHELVHEDDEIIGLLVEWRDGRCITDPKGVLFRADHVAKLEKILTHLYSSKIVLDGDVFSESNTMLSPNGTLWLAECKASQATDETDMQRIAGQYDWHISEYKKILNRR